MAKKRGFEVVNVTTVYKGVFEDEAINPLLPHIDIVSMSVDDMRCKDAEDMWSQVDDAWGYIRQEHPHVHFNINLLWTPTVFQWAEEGQLDYAFESFHYGNREKWSIQHLIYKPLSIYESVEWFWEKYQWIMENKPNINICGDGK